ncbi:TPA: single-stranded DNA-binding protein [Klebsiella quasipneumoniae]|uniref:single-stranded DNA-binding protein n=1 Tax=Klebsiella pneumoniae complex TaxID=3390273 RepID=UPI0007D6D4FB|nr:single-stranded DNA-binding protein [Klebsiella variicola]HBZ7729965.1 single-stranded DNA-binding protein [Klebsiella variicola subsp. variicola]HEB4934501.1 single-stranded DNA-binding protein [Klebsiella quasipneumoniae]
MTAQISAYAGWCPLLKSEPRTSGTYMAMDHLYNAVAKHRKGDLVSVAGNMQLNQWTGQDGGTQQGYQVIADSVLSARTVRPGGKAGQQGQATDALRRAHEQQPLDNGYEGYEQTPPYEEDS